MHHMGTALVPPVGRDEGDACLERGREVNDQGGDRDGMDEDMGATGV